MELKNLQAKTDEQILLSMLIDSCVIEEPNNFEDSVEEEFRFDASIA